MKSLLTILLLSICSICFGQTSVNPYKKIADHNNLKGLSTGRIVRDSGTFYFDAFNRSKIEYHDNLLKQFQENQKFVNKQDSAYWQFVKDFLIANKVDLDRVSPYGDSLKVTPEGIFLKLKPKKK